MTNYFLEGAMTRGQGREAEKKKKKQKKNENPKNRINEKGNFFLSSTSLKDVAGTNLANVLHLPSAFPPFELAPYVFA